MIGHCVTFHVKEKILFHICMYWPEIFCLKAVVLSARMCVLVFQDQNTLLKWNILSLLAYKQAIRQNIWLQKGVLVLEDQYIHASRENNSFETEYFWPIHMSRERERTSGFHDLQFIERSGWSSLQNCLAMASLTLFGFSVSEFLKAVIGN